MSVASRDYDWRCEAVCASVGGTEWLPEPGTRINPAVFASCAVCPVREHCLRSALAHGDHFGVWAGLTWPELSGLRCRILAGEPPAQVITDALTAATQLTQRPAYGPGLTEIPDDHADTATVATRIKALPPPTPEPAPTLSPPPQRRAPGRAQLICAHCGQHFQPRTNHGRLPRFCSPAHAQRHHLQRRARRRTQPRQAHPSEPGAA